MKLSTKAQNLDILKKLGLQKSKIPKFFKFSVREWILKKNEIIKVLSKELNKKILELKGTVDPVQIQKLQQKIDILIKKQNKNENKT